MSQFGWLIVLIASGAAAYLWFRRRSRRLSPGAWGGVPRRALRALSLHPQPTIDSIVVSTIAEALAQKVVPGWSSAYSLGTRDVYVHLPQEAYELLVSSRDEQADLHRQVTAAIPGLFRSRQRGAARGEDLDIRGEFRIFPLQGSAVSAMVVSHGAPNPFNASPAFDPSAMPPVVFLDEIVTQLLPDSIETQPPASKSEVKARVVVDDAIFEEISLASGRTIVVGRGSRSDLHLPERRGLSRSHIQATLLANGEPSRVTLTDTSHYGSWMLGEKLPPENLIILPATVQLGPDPAVRLEISA